MTIQEMIKTNLLNKKATAKNNGITFNHPIEFWCERSSAEQQYLNLKVDTGLITTTNTGVLLIDVTDAKLFNSTNRKNSLIKFIEQWPNAELIYIIYNDNLTMRTVVKLIQEHTDLNIKHFFSCNTDEDSVRAIMYNRTE